MKNKGLLLVILICVLGLVGCQAVGNEKPQSDQGGSLQDHSVEEVAKPVKYTSNNKIMSIMLPDELWTVEEDSDNLCMFSSRYGVIMLSEMQDANIVIPNSADDLKSVLQKEGYNSENYQVIEYDNQNIATLKAYKAVVKYDKDKASYAYGIIYGTVLGDKEYMASAILYGEDTDILERVKTSLYSFEVNPDAGPTATPVPTETPVPTATPAVTATPAPTVTPAPTATPAPTPTPEPVTRRVKQSGNVRSAPNETDSTVWGTIPGGTDVLVYGQVNGWYEVEYNGSRGYIYKRFID